MIELNNISFEYDKKTSVLKNFNLKVDNGEIVSIIGRSGLGKSTILRIISGLEKPIEGDVLINGEKINHLPTHKRNVGYIFQNQALFPHLSLRKNIEFGLKHKSEKTDVDLIAKKIKIHDLLDRYPHEVSGGERQRAAIARSIITKPEVLLLDEPFTGLDQELKDSVRIDVYNIIKEYNITAILVTHDIEDTKVLQSRIIKLD